MNERDAGDPIVVHGMSVLTEIGDADDTYPRWRMAYPCRKSVLGYGEPTRNEINCMACIVVVGSR